LVGVTYPSEFQPDASNAGEVGNAIVSAMNVQVYALAASFSLSSTNIGCQTVGYLAVMRAQP